MCLKILKTLLFFTVQNIIVVVLINYIMLKKIYLFTSDCCWTLRPRTWRRAPTRWGTRRTFASSWACCPRASRPPTFSTSSRRPGRGQPSACGRRCCAPSRFLRRWCSCCARPRPPPARCPLPLPLPLSFWIWPLLLGSVTKRVR